MTTWQLIRTMAQRKFEFQCGLHTSERGYWASFTKEDPSTIACDECGSTLMEWENSGHAMTLHRAVVMAAKLARGESIAVPSPGAFT